MDNQKVFDMKFSKVYPLLIDKVERKGGKAEDLHKITSWLTGYSTDEIQNMLLSDISYGDFFENAPSFTPYSENIKGSICGVKIRVISEKKKKKIRMLDKLADELSKGKTPEKITDKYTKD